MFFLSLRRKLSFLYRTTTIHASYLRALVRLKKSFLRAQIEGDDPLGERDSLAIFMHWDPQGAIHPYVQYYLEALRREGFAILFVTNSPKLPKTSIAVLKPLCMRILWRRNVGYDFGAYKEAILHIRSLMPSLQRLLIVNDSVYGPLRPLGESLANADPARADIWGMTDSWERRYHLQSYFLLCYPAAFCSQAFLKFWGKIPYVNNKHYVISRFEIGFSRAMLKEGLRLSALFPVDDVARDVLSLWRRIGSGDEKEEKLPERTHQFLVRIVDYLVADQPMNQTHYLWDFLLARWRFPFIKRELLTRNPGNVPWLSRWEELVREVSDYDVRMIGDHLKLNKRSLR